MTQPANEILPAVAKAMGMVEKLSKGERNKHDGYNFASIDDFLALVNPICAQCGLIPHVDEGAREDFEKESQRGKSAWMRQSFTITLYHVSGQSLPPVTRTVEVLRNGAQAYGSAQSYALKQYWRGLLLIPTGDKDDADYAPTEAGTISRPQQRQQPRHDPAPQAIEYINGATTLDELKTAWGNLPADVQRIPQVIAAKDNRKADLQAADQIDGGNKNADLDDAIPYEGK